MMNTLEERVQRALREDVTIVPHDAAWPKMFRREAEHLRSCLPTRLIRRIEHFGSTAVPGLAAKPVIDMLVEVTSLRAARTEIAPLLEAQGYDYFWRPTIGDDVPPWYAFFIKRNESGTRTHHIHMMTRRPVFQPHWERLLFRDYLIAHSEVAAEYEQVKKRLAKAHPNDRLAYTVGKTDFILSVMARAKQMPNKIGPAHGSQPIRSGNMARAEHNSAMTTLQEVKDTRSHTIASAGERAVLPSIGGLVLAVMLASLACGCRTAFTPLPPKETRTYQSILEWTLQNGMPGAALCVRTPQTNFLGSVGWADV